MSAWHFTEGSHDTVFTAWDCITGDFLTGDAARNKMDEDGGVAVSVMDADRRRWWATVNPEKASGRPWWAMPTPDDAPMSGPVSPFRGGWKDYSVCGEVDEGLTDEERTVLYGNPNVAKPQGVMTVNDDEWTREEYDTYAATHPRMTFAPTGASPLSENGYDVNKERAMDENTEKTKAIGVFDTAKANRLIDAYGKWCGVTFPETTVSLEIDITDLTGISVACSDVTNSVLANKRLDWFKSVKVRVDLTQALPAIAIKTFAECTLTASLTDAELQQLIEYFEKNTDA